MREYGLASVLMAFFTALALLPSSCAGPACTTAGTARDSAKLSLSVLPGSFVDGGSATRFTLDVQQQKDELAVSVSALGASGLKALYFDLASGGQALEVVSAGPSAAFSKGAEVVCLALAEPGRPDVLHFGAVLAKYPERAGFNGDGVLATLRLRLGTARSAAHAVSTPPDSDASRVTLALDGAQLKWYYGSQGDYDQNGEVNIADLTPLGANFGSAGPWDFKLAIWCVDGDGNSEINIADITPIGQNFGNRLDGYMVYYSTSAGDYPADNTAHNGAGAIPTNTVLFGDAGGGAGERKWFTASIPAPTPSDYYWARPYDQGDEGTPSELFNTSAAASWHVFDVAGGQPGGINEAGQYASLALVDGYPAIAYYWGEPFYVRATDDRGTTWGTAAQIFNDGLDCGHYMSLAVINGFPAVAYYTDDNSYPAYLQAQDADGNTWSTPVAIEPGAYAQSMSLAEVNSRPAVAYYISQMPGPTYHVMYERAGDSNGLDWSAPSQDIDSGEQSGNTSLAVIGGRPAVAYRAQRTQPTICFKRADDVSGIAWGQLTEAYANPDLLAFGSICLREIDGTPAVCFVHQSITGSRPVYMRASDVAGTTWDAPAPQYIVGTGTYVIGDYMSMAMVGSQLYCAMANYITLALDCAIANASAPSGWDLPQVVDDGGGNIVGWYCSMADINGYPAVAYYDSDNAALKYAVFF